MRCIITSDVATIGSKTYSLKSTVDRALTSLGLRQKPRLGSRCSSSKSLDHLSDTLASLAPPPTLGYQRSVSSGGYSGGDDEEPSPVKKPKPPYIVLMSSRAEGRTQSDIPWNEECDFKLEEVSSSSQSPLVSVPPSYNSKF